MDFFIKVVALLICVFVVGLVYSIVVGFIADCVEQTRNENEWRKRQGWTK